MSSVDDLIAQIKALRVQESRLVLELEEAHRLERSVVDFWMIGQRVCILNRVKFPGDRKATVTSVGEDIISIVADNGFRTWRAPKNLAKLENQQHNL